MAYCTIDDIKKLLPEKALALITDDAGTGAIDEAKVTEAISSADAEIDAYSGVRYTVPFGIVPAIIKKLSVDIAVYNLHSRRGEEVPASRKERYRNAVRILEAVALGAVSLNAPAAGKTDAETNKAEDEQVFSRETLKEF